MGSRIPRDIGPGELIRVLAMFDYAVTRQRGSHIRLSTQRRSEHHITIPNHSPLRLGTLAAIIRDVADHLDIAKAEIIDQLSK